MLLIRYITYKRLDKKHQKILKEFDYAKKALAVEPYCHSKLPCFSDENRCPYFIADVNSQHACDYWVKQDNLEKITQMSASFKEAKEKYENTLRGFRELKPLLYIRGK